MQLSALAMPLLRAERDAAIVNFASALAISPTRSDPVYCATRAGLRTFSRALQYQVKYAGLPIFAAMTAGRGRGKISADQAATAILRGVEHGKREVFVGGARLLAVLLRLFPGLAEQ
jgi:short-subunit dehydrogenase involved in D-alanine esterification of teichoic acids